MERTSPHRQCCCAASERRPPRGTRSLPGVRACFNTLLLKKEKRQREESKSELAGAAKQLWDLASLLSFAKVAAAASQAPSELSLWGGTLRYLKSLHPKKQGFFPYIYRAGDAVMSQSRLPGPESRAVPSSCPTAVPTPGARPGAAASDTDPRSLRPLDAPVGFSIRVPPRCSSQPLLAGPAKAFGWDSLCLMEPCACC